MDRVISDHTADTVQCLPTALDHFDGRALVVASQGDFVLRMRPKGRGPASFFPDTQELQLLNRLGFGPRPEDVIDVLVGHEDMVFRNPGHRRIVEEGWIETFSGTSVFQRLALEKIGADPGLPDLSECMRWNDKSVFQRTFGSCLAKNGDGRFHHSPGVGPALLPVGGHATRSNLDELLNLLRHRNDSSRDLIIKPASSASCIGQRIVDQPVYQSVFSDLDWWGTTRTVNRFVAQELVPHDMDFSWEFEIPEPGALGTPRVRRLCGQHVIDGDFQGNFWPVDLSDEMRQATRYSAEMIVAYMASNDVWGVGSIDYVGNSKTGQAWAVEINLRKTAAYYGREPARQRFGCLRPFDMRSFRIPRGWTIEGLEEHFDGLIFGQPGDEIGWLPFCFLPNLPGERHGVSYGVCYAQTRDELQLLSRQVEARKAELPI